MKTGKEIVNEWQMASREDHRKNIAACVILFLSYVAILILMLWYGESWKDFWICMTSLYFVFRVFIFIVERDAQRERKIKKSWSELQKRLTTKSKVE